MFALHLKEDFHVHSTFSDGLHSIEENVCTAIERGIRKMCCVDVVTQSVQWIPDFVETIRNLRVKYASHIELYAGVEAKFLDDIGTLDLPQNLDGINYIFAADHAFPYKGNLYMPTEVRQMLVYESVKPEALIRNLARTVTGAMWKYQHTERQVVIAHLFSILPKVGIRENSVPLDYIAGIARAASYTNSMIEISERWLCPSPEITRVLLSMGVKMPISSDSHSKEHIGRYRYVVEVQEELFSDQLNFTLTG